MLKRTSLFLILAALGLAACGSDERPIVVNTPPANPSSTVVVPPTSTQHPVVVVPQQ
jgi:hypothetical protein